MFARAFLSTSSGFVEEAVSHAIAVPMNSVVIDATVANFSSTSAQLFLTAEGSYDGSVWKTVTSLDVNIRNVPFGHDSSGVVDVDVAYIRLRAAVTGTNEDALFDASLVFSHQE